MSSDLRRNFTGRADLIDYCRQQFPDAARISPQVSETLGGRVAALARVALIQPVKYASNRNFLSGKVSRLSMYLRHGALSLAEVRDKAVSMVSDKLQVTKFVTELAWRDYWLRVYADIGDGIHQSREPYKTGFDETAYADTLPEDLIEARTGLDCIDAFVNELHQTGYLHNHARMWMAAYVVHWRRVRWQAGARWFLSHLLDGDVASNHLSWQWVASTFSHKPYFFNRENLERYTEGQFCQKCPQRGHCAFEGTYEQLEDKLFPRMKVPQ